VTATTPDTSLPAQPRATLGRRVYAWLHRHRGVQAALLLAPPAGWFGVVYLGSLALLLVTAFWTFDGVTGRVVHAWTVDNFVQLVNQPAFRTVAIRTIAFAAAVTLADMVIAFPIAYYMAQVAGPRTRSVLFMLCLLPLWAS
jgi:putative spermidine/putrescine transport system permease protein